MRDLVSSTFFLKKYPIFIGTRVGYNCRLFCRRYFEMHFHEREIWYTHSIITEICCSDQIDNKTVLVQLMAWHRTGNKPSSEPMLVKMPYCINRPQRFVLTVTMHDDVIKWKHFPRHWPFVRGIHRSPVNSPHKGRWRRALMFSLICAWKKRLSKQWWDWWFGTPSRSLWRHCIGCLFITSHVVQHLG